MVIKPAHLRNVFVKAQENILSIVSNKSLIGMATYKNKQILSRVQEQLDFMVNKSWEYAPIYSLKFIKCQNCITNLTKFII